MKRADDHREMVCGGSEIDQEIVLEQGLIMVPKLPDMEQTITLVEDCLNAQRTYILWHFQGFHLVV